MERWTEREPYERLTAVEERLRALTEDVVELRREFTREVGSSRDPRSLRGRVHNLESVAAASTATREAADALRAATTQRWTRREKIIGAAVAIYLALLTTATTVAQILHGVHH